MSKIPHEEDRLLSSSGNAVARLDALKHPGTEPIAVIGTGCRVPGSADDAEEFWQLLINGVDAIAELPSDRWSLSEHYDANPDTPGKAYVKHGGFLTHVDQFDTAFFGISPREATSTDPQQRLLLEVSWEAIENAGYAPDGLIGSRTGVFIGIGAPDYAILQVKLGDYARIDAYTGTGSTFSVSAGRLSYLLGLHGPSMAIDTACSSSLVAVHTACQSLRHAECNLALAGGVHLMLTPESTIFLCKARALAPDGRCKTFDSTADGYVRGEGCGIVVLKRLSDAIADGDRILAVIRGSAVNHDGRSSGLTVPNGLAQERLIREALFDAGVQPAQVSYVEAHGTGTPLGDPIEIDALKAALMEGRTEQQRLAIGSVKTNIGHLEHAAGIAGLIKVVLALQHKQIPPHLHLKELNPHISLKNTQISIPTELAPWPSGENKRIAGVSSFGLSGTNAHVVLEEAPAEAAVENEVERPVHLLSVSAKTEAALQQLAARYEHRLSADPQVPLGDVCFTANTGRAHFGHRLAVAAASPQAMGEQLSAFVAGNRAPGLVSGQVSGSQQHKLGFLFTGQGSQYVGMGRELYETQPLFRRVLDRCDELLRPYMEQPLLSVLYPEGGDSGLLDQTAYTQPALFALEYALAELWKSWGIEPAVVMGHSVGEYVAACVAGVFSLEDGLKLIAERGRLMQALPQDGEMVSVLADEARVAAALEPYAREVSLAGINGPQSMVISGKREAVQAVVAVLEAEGIKTQRLQVSHAFHSPLMEPMLEAFARVAGEVRYAAPRLAVVSNVSGELASEEIAGPEYWCRHVRQPVRFADGMQVLHRQGCGVLLELGPKPTLLGMGQLCLPAGEGVWLPSLRQGHSDWQQLLQSLGQLYVHGVAVDWSGFDREYKRRRVALPTYPFQRQRYWVETSGKATQAQGVVSQAPEQNQSQIIRLLQQGEAQQLVEALENAEEVSAETKQYLPEVVKALIGQHQRHLSASALEEWLYALDWQAKPRREKAGQAISLLPAPGRWLIFADRGGVGQAVAALLEARGQSCILVFAGEGYGAKEAGVWSLDPVNPAEFERLFHAVLQSSPLPLSGVLHLWSLDATPPEALTLRALEQAQRLGCGSALHLVQALVKHKGTATPRLWLVTRGAVPVGEQPLAVAQSPLWGFGKVVALEHPEVWGGLLDLAPEAGEETATAVLAELWDSQGEDQIALREQGRYVARLVRQSLSESPGFKPGADGSYLITGGLGALGLTVARWLVEQGARHLVLTGRRGASPEAQEVLSELQQNGAQILVAKADVSREADMVRVLEEISASQAPLRGVVHAAGVPGYQPATEMELATLESVLRPKVGGAWILHQLTRSLRLDFFVGFSSIASVWGSKGQAHYAAANCFLDTLAHYRRLQGLPSLSINWGPWGGGGMASAEAQMWLTRMGVKSLLPDQAVAALARLLRTNRVQCTVSDVDWSVFKELYEARGKGSLFEQIEAGSQAEDLQPQVTRSAILERLEGALPDERQGLLLSHIQTEVASVLGFESSQVPEPQQGFFDMGMDSLMAVELKRRLESGLGHPLPSTLAFDFPNIQRLADYLSIDVFKWDSAVEGGAEIQRDESGREQTVSDIAQLTDEEVEVSIADRLAKLQALTREN